MKSKVLSAEFFNRPTPAAAKELLGKFLVRNWQGEEIASMITEVEAYDGFEDLGSHARRGKTARNWPMYGPGGYWYVYFTYGMHWMLNITTRESGYPAAVLIRGTEAVSGPGRITRHFHIDGKLSGVKAGRKNGLWLEDRGMKINPRAIQKSPRIGIDYAGPYWAAKPWRFLIKTSAVPSRKNRKK